MSDDWFVKTICLSVTEAKTYLCIFIHIDCYDADKYTEI